MFTEEQMIAVVESQKARAEKRPACKIERMPRFVGGEPQRLRLAIARGMGAEVLDRQRHGRCRAITWTGLPPTWVKVVLSASCRATIVLSARRRMSVSSVPDTRSVCRMLYRPGHGCSCSTKQSRAWALEAGNTKASATSLLARLRVWCPPSSSVTSGVRHGGRSRAQVDERRSWVGE